VLAEPAGVVVTFQPGALICILRVDGEEVPPTRWPVRRRAERPKPRTVSFPTGIVAVVVLLLAAAGGAFWLVRERGLPSARSAATTGAYRAENGRFVAHYPPAFVARRAVVPSDISGVAIEDPGRGETVVLLALATGDVPRDSWLAHKRLNDEALANLPRGGAGWEEHARAEETCIGQPGAVVRGTVKDVAVWSCAFVRDGAAYLAMVALRDDATSEDEKRLRAIVEDTELTKLGEIRSGEP
jgi:hypothetical protein